MRTPSLIVLSALLAALLAVTAVVCRNGSSCPDPRTCPDDASRVNEETRLTVTGAAAPVWDEPAAGTTSPPGNPDRVEIHLDISSPMAGYLPPGGDDDLSVFQLVAQNAAQHMARVFGGANAPVRWVGVGHELRNLGARPQIERGVFDGRSTQLDESMARMLGDFRAGRAEAAALVSDLMATGDVTGPLTVFGALGEWLASPDVRTGAFHVGLFGVKADYWGVRARGCAPRGPLGCRFDELQRRWLPLEAVEQIPVYVLVLGRGAARVRDVMDSLQATVDELIRGRGVPIETRSELLTRAALGHETTVACRAGAPGGDDEPRPQYALFGNDRGQYCCVRDDLVRLSCNVEGGFQPTTARAAWVAAPPAPAASARPVAQAGGDGDGEATATPTAATEAANGDDGGAASTPALPPGADARIDGTSLSFDFPCAAVRCGPPIAEGLALSIEATGTVEVPAGGSADAPGGEADRGAGDWDGWSTETGEVGRTLQLQGFVDAVRIVPDRYALETPALLRFPGRP